MLVTQRDEPGTGGRITGTTTEAFGKITGNENTESAGEAQQQQAQKSDEASRHEQKAECKRAEQADHKGDQMRREGRPTRVETYAIGVPPSAHPGPRGDQRCPASCP